MVTGRIPRTSPRPPRPPHALHRALPSRRGLRHPHLRRQDAAAPASSPPGPRPRPRPPPARAFAHVRVRVARATNTDARRTSRHAPYTSHLARNRPHIDAWASVRPRRAPQSALRSRAHTPEPEFEPEPLPSRQTYPDPRRISPTPIRGRIQPGLLFLRLSSMNIALIVPTAPPQGPHALCIRTHLRAHPHALPKITISPGQNARPSAHVILSFSSSLSPSLGYDILNYVLHRPLCYNPSRGPERGRFRTVMPDADQSPRVAPTNCSSFPHQRTPRLPSPPTDRPHCAAPGARAPPRPRACSRAHVLACMPVRPRPRACRCGARAA